MLYVKPYMRTVVVPWPEPQSVYHNDGADCDVVFGQHRFVIRYSGEYRFGHDYATWTFVKFATAKGYVTFRWCGSSNGCYSEEPSYRLASGDLILTTDGH